MQVTHQKTLLFRVQLSYTCIDILDLQSLYPKMSIFRQNIIFSCISDIYHLKTGKSNCKMLM